MIIGKKFQSFQLIGVENYMGAVKLISCLTLPFKKWIPSFESCVMVDW